MTAVPSILVVGAGELGEAVLAGLAHFTSSSGRLGRQQVNVKVMLRRAAQQSTDAGKQALLQRIHAQYNAECIEGDIEGEAQEQLAAKLAGFETIIVCAGMFCAPGTQLKLTQAVLQACVRYYIPWQFGVDYDIIGRGSAQDLFTEQLDVRAALRAQTASKWTIVSTGMFMNFLFEPAFGAIDLPNKAVHALGSWRQDVTVTTPEDIGRVVADIVLGEPVHESGVVFVAGDTLSYGQLADALDEVLPSPVQRVLWDVDHLKTELAKEPGDSMRKYRIVFAGVGVSWPGEQTINAERSMHLTDVRTWLQAKASKGEL